MDYRTGIESVLRTYGSQPALLVRGLQSLIETAIENERGRLRAEIEAAMAVPVCSQCRQALEAEMAETYSARAKAAIENVSADKLAPAVPWVATGPQPLRIKRSYRKKAEYWERKRR